MGQDASKEAFESGQISAKRMKEINREVQAIRIRIQTFRARSGTAEICSSLHSSWKREKPSIIETWGKLSDPGRRAMITDIRERVLIRAKILHSVIAPKLIHPAQKIKVVRKLMEKCSFELFDTSIIYDDESLPQLVEDILSVQGGGPEIPFGLLFEVNNSFEVEGDELTTTELIQQNSIESEAGIGEEGKSPSTQSLQSLRSANSLQQYYSKNAKNRNKRKSYSKSISTLLSFVPSEGIDPVSRKKLTMELLMEMRHAFLVHFAILVFSELFDETSKVVYKYEYDSGSDTDLGQNETDFDEEDEDDNSDTSSDGSSTKN